MKRILAAILTASIPYFAGTAHAETPVSYHLAFENFDFKSDDWIEKTGLKTIAERKWETVDGKFGKALYLGAVPLKYDNDNMSGLDLDMVTAVVFNIANSGNKGRGYDEPFIWSAGRLHPGRGSVAFWVKGNANPDDKDTRTILFEQTTTSWGRKERQLIEIELFRDSSIEAYVEDTRYVQHKVKSGKVWKNNDWNHVLLNWDKSEGVSLWINGKKAASSDSSWWDNQRPGLFHMPMAQASYDEFYIFDRPLADKEIAALYRSNETPVTDGEMTYPPENAERLKKAFTSSLSTLPVARPSDGRALVFKNITPERIHDEGIQGWWISDGRYELAWPHEYSVFTIIPGDVDFHAEKADILPPMTAEVNYLTFEGNLDGVSVIKGDRGGSFDSAPSLKIPVNDGFFYGAMVSGLGDSELRIPFTKSYGAPPGFESDGDVLRLPQSGDLRIHEVGLFNVSEKKVPILPGAVIFHIDPQLRYFDGDRYPHALESLHSSADRKTAGLYKSANQTDPQYTGTSAMQRLNLISEPFSGKLAVKTVLIDMKLEITGADDNDAAIQFKLLDPAVPSHTWTHAEFRLEGFGKNKQDRLLVALEFDPLFLMTGDRLWLEMMSTTGLMFDQQSTVTILPDIDWVRAEPVYALKTLKPAILTYGRSFEYIPWEWDKSLPDIDKPTSFGGMFDMAYPWQAVLRVNPGDQIANIYRAFTTGDYSRGRYPSNMNSLFGYEVQSKQFERYPGDKGLTVAGRTFPAPVNAPEWAVYFREFQSFRNRIVTWWRHHQRSDGQAGGGWNDDTLIFSRALGDMPLDSNPDALALYNNVFDGFDKTNYFKDGYCRIHPIDRLHNGDFVRERYKSLIYNLGDPRSAVWACEEAWHFGKEDRTPVNYGDGKAFLFGKDVLEWYWGRRKTDTPFELKDPKGLTETMLKAAVVNNDTTLWRFTEAWCHTDDQSQYGSGELLDMLLGGWGNTPRRGGDDYFRKNIDITVGVGWIEGGGPQLGRMVEYSGNTGLKVRMYSFDRFDRHVTARLYRLETGDYSISLKADSDGDGRYESDVLTKEKTIRRFDRLELDLPPKTPLLLEVTQVRPARDKGELPDLATSPYFAKLEGSKLTVTVLNIGAADAEQFSVTVTCPGGNELGTRMVGSLDGAADFVPGRVELTFEGLPPHPYYLVTVDKNEHVDEIFEENNSFSIVSGTF